MENIFTLADVIRMAEEEVELAGEGYYHPGQCRYLLNDGTPACIVGRMLAKNTDWFKDSIKDGNNGLRIANLLNDLGKDDLFTSEAREFLYHLQLNQDLGSQWGEALSMARRHSIGS